MSAHALADASTAIISRRKPECPYGLWLTTCKLTGKVENLYLSASVSRLRFDRDQRHCNQRLSEMGRIGRLGSCCGTRYRGGCPRNSWRFPGGGKESWWLPWAWFSIGIRHDKPQQGDHHDEGKVREEGTPRQGREHLLPLVNVFALAGGALDRIIDVIGRAAIEAVLDISAAEVAGERRPGKRRGAAEAAYHGRQRGRVYLADRAVRIEKPRLRGAEGEVAVPAYEALRRRSGLGERMLELLLAGLGTRSYGKAIGGMAETAGVSKSSVSRRAAESAGERLRELAERRLDDRDHLVVYVDGIQVGGHHVLAALGVDAEGNKRILGVREGASENAVVALGLLESLVERGLDPGRARLFVLDGSKALRAAAGQVFGSGCLVRRCRNHKMRNVVGHLPKELHDQARAVLRAAWKLDAKEGGARIEQFASWVETRHPDAAGSLREGLDELFTVSAIGLTPALKRCLGTTNVIDNAHSGMRRRTGRVTRWRDGSMAVRWTAAAFLDAEKGYRGIMGHKDLWILKAHLDETGQSHAVEKKDDAA